MGAQNKLFHRLIWLIDTVYSAKRIKMADIDKRWERSHYNDKHERTYGARTLHRHREAITELFGIEIACDDTTYEYYISSRGDIDGKGIRAWLVDTFAVSNMVNLAGDMKNRIFFEEIPEGSRYLSTIVSAMKEGRQLFATYQGFRRDKPHSFLLAPYCLKVFEHRWYLVGKPEDHPEEDEPRVYALDRMKDLVQVDKPFEMPRGFKPAEFFKHQLGIDRSITEPEDVRIKVKAHDANYLRSLPLHHSQKEVEQTEDYSVFTYHIAPTYDFIMELRKFGAKLEVLAPEKLRKDFADEVDAMKALYK
jgi:hypothetical protein